MATEEVEPLFKVESGDRRMATIDDVDTMRDNRDVDGLIRALQDDDEFVRSQAALSLGTIADPKAKEPLDRMRTEDPSASAREAAKTAYRWVAGRIQEVEATQGRLEPKTPPTG
jgi:HEAT repeat protein